VKVFGDTNELTVNSIFPKHTPDGVSLSLDYDIKIPKKALLDVLNKVGSIVIQDIAGSLFLDLAVGNINVFYPAFPKPTDIIDVRIKTGSATLALPAQAAFDIDASVTTGAINAGGFPINVKRTLVGAYVHDSVKRGGADVILHVTVGNIALSGLRRKEARPAERSDFSFLKKHEDNLNMRWK
jgi:hypothetical protein